MIQCQLDYLHDYTPQQFFWFVINCFILEVLCRMRVRFLFCIPFCTCLDLVAEVSIIQGHNFRVDTTDQYGALDTRVFR